MATIHQPSPFPSTMDFSGIPFSDGLSWTFEDDRKAILTDQNLYVSNGENHYWSKYGVIHHWKVEEMLTTTQLFLSTALMIMEMQGDIRKQSELQELEIEA